MRTVSRRPGTRPLERTRCLALVASVLLTGAACPSLSSAGGPHGHGHGGWGPRGHYHPHAHYHGPSFYFGFRPYPVIPIGTRIRYIAAPPPTAVIVTYNGVSYHRCGSVYYRPVYYQDQLVYMEVPTPITTTTTVGSVNGPAPALSPEVAAALRTVPSTPPVAVAKSTNTPAVANNAVSTVSKPASDPIVLPASATTPLPIMPTPSVAAGTIVTSLPDGATAINVRGSTYFRVGSTFYLPLVGGETTRYVVVPNPGVESR